MEKRNRHTRGPVQHHPIRYINVTDGMNAKPKFEGVRGCCVTDGMGITLVVGCWVHWNRTTSVPKSVPRG